MMFNNTGSQCNAQKYVMHNIKKMHLVAFMNNVNNEKR